MNLKLKLLFLTMFMSNSFCLDEYIYWANISNKDLILYHEDQVVSPAMRLSKDPSSSFACELVYEKLKKLYPDVSLALPPKTKAQKASFLNSYKAQLFSCFVGQKIIVNAKIQTNSLKASSLTNVRMAPLRFLIDFKPYEALIYIIKNKD